MARTTIIIPTSPIPSHPSTDMIDKVITSARVYLPDSPLIIMCDGVRREQKYFKKTYDEYIVRLTKKYPEATILVSETHKHQAGITKDALSYIRTPLLFFLEHDFELFGDIPMKKFEDIVETKLVSLIRVLLDDWLIPEHDHMMLGIREMDGVRLMHTFQWSQRPHIAKIELYKELMEQLPAEANIMIEDFFHGKIAQDYEEHGIDRGLHMYIPRGKKQRFRHLDGRENEPKFAMNYGVME